MKNILVNRTYQALNSLYLNSRDMQKTENVKQLRQKHPLEHAKEYGTIKLTTARQSGHSTAIAKFVCEHKMNFAIISPTLDTLKYLYLKIYDYLETNGKIQDRLSIENIEINRCKTILATRKNYDNCLRGLSLDAIICDISCFLNNKDIENIYQMGITNMIYKPFVYFMFLE